MLIKGGCDGFFFSEQGVGPDVNGQKCWKNCGEKQDHKDIFSAIKRKADTEQVYPNTQVYNTEHMQYKQ